jgi:hypothetical protein
MRFFTTITLLSVLGAQISSARPVVYSNTATTVDNSGKTNTKGAVVGLAIVAGLTAVGVTAMRAIRRHKKIPVEVVDGPITTDNLVGWFKRVGPKYGMRPVV